MSRAILCAALALGCGGGGSDAPPDAAPPVPDSARDLISMNLAVDVGARTAVATIEIAASDSGGLSLEVGDLAILSVRDAAGSDLLHDVTDGRIDIGLAANGEPSTVVIDYGYQIHSAFDGALASGVTLLWPYYCGNLFPCHSDPADGLTLELSLTGVPGDQVAVYPEAIAADAPSYMLAWAIGEYTFLDLGQTTSGTRIGAWYLPGGEAAATSGTAILRDAFEWLESNFGPYRFGDAVASVAAPWGAGALGGMEHHPLWHVAEGAMSSQEVHVHEAVHGWYGNGIRIACWEDFVLSEGTTAYLTARAIEAVSGTTVSDAVWASYGRRLAGVAGLDAWPEGCGAIDIIDDGLFTDAPYMKGAHFFRALENRIGRETLDGALASFYAAHVLGAATMQDLLDHVEAESGYDPDGCADAWLRGTSVPAEPACP